MKVTELIKLRDDIEALIYRKVKDQEHVQSLIDGILKLVGPYIDKEPEFVKIPNRIFEADWPSQLITTLYAVYAPGQQCGGQIITTTNTDEIT